MSLPPHATAPQLARFYRVPISTIYRWASEDHWPRTSTRPTRYDWDAADDSYNRRQENYDRSQLTQPADLREDQA